MFKAIRATAFTFILIFFSVSIVNAESVTDKVIGISDGDTITMLIDGRPEKIRLHGIDSPEQGQDYGTKAKQFTSSLVYGKT
ncbi:MAG: thermonuclease family protein, partial [Chlorobiales bacterium]|nr:thermonuclease family protein [Chlorobiales bacterium]